MKKPNQPDTKLSSGAQLWTGTKTLREMQRIGGAGTLIKWSTIVFYAILASCVGFMAVYPSLAPAPVWVFPLFVWLAGASMIRLNVCGVEVSDHHVKLVGFWKTSLYQVTEVSSFERGALTEWLKLRNGKRKLIVGLLFWNDGVAERSLTREAVAELNRRLELAKKAYS